MQFRAVTEADYAQTAELMPQVLSAVASFRWTGSWYTVFLGILPSDPADLINAANGVMQLSPALAQDVALFLEGYRLVGYDLEIRPPQFLALEIDLLVCAAADHFRSDVQQAVEAALSNKQLPDGSTGFFFPGKFVFGKQVYLSQIYASRAERRGRGLGRRHALRAVRPAGQRRARARRHSGRTLADRAARQ